MRLAVTANAKARLRRFECAWCNQRMDRLSCGGIYDTCPVSVRLKRAADCLAASRSDALRDEAAYLYRQAEQNGNEA
jgi:hypothetical protein